MSEDQVRTIEQRLDALTTRRNVERFVERVGYAIQVIAITAMLWVGSEIVGLKTVAAELSEKITAAAQLSDFARASTAQRLNRHELQIDNLDNRLRRLEQGMSDAGPP